MLRSVGRIVPRQMGRQTIFGNGADSTSLWQFAWNDPCEDFWELQITVENELVLAIVGGRTKGKSPTARVLLRLKCQACRADGQQRSPRKGMQYFVQVRPHTCALTSGQYHGCNRHAHDASCPKYQPQLWLLSKRVICLVSRKPRKPAVPSSRPIPEDL